MLTEDYLAQMEAELFATQEQEDAEELAAWYWENWGAFELDLAA